jgi:WD40 repeat protein
MGAEDGSIRLWNVAKKERVGADRATGKPLFDLAITPDKKSLVTAEPQGDVRVWDLAKPDAVRSFHISGAFHPSPGEFGSFTLAADGARVATATADGIVEVWDLATGKALRKWDIRLKVHSLSFLPGGKHLATANENGTIYLLDLP